jgi:hypothetical protein
MATKKVLEVYQGFEITKGMGFSNTTGFSAQWEETVFTHAKKAELKKEIDDFWATRKDNPPIVKKLVFQVNLQPTWKRILPLLIDQVENDSGRGSEVYENAKKELFHMAQVADYYADRAKTDANVVAIIELLLQNVTEEFKQRQPEAVKDILELIADFKEEGDDDGK